MEEEKIWNTQNYKKLYIIIIMIYTTCDLYYMYNFQYDV